MSYTYNSQGNLASIRSSNANGATVDYGYDALNRLSSVTDNHLPAPSNVTTYGYDSAGNLQSFVYPNLVAHVYSYNTLNRLTNLTVSRLAASQGSYTYTFGPTGNRTSVTELSGRKAIYIYDDLYRLKQEDISGGAPNGSIAYVYDKVGNRKTRTSTVAGITNQTFNYDANDRIATEGYDNNGNTINANSHVYKYDYENHLVDQDGGAVRIIYDGDGNRVAKTVGGITTRYLVDDRNPTSYAQVLEEIVGDVVQKSYTYGHKLISQNQASGLSFYGYDGHSSVRQLTNVVGAVTDAYAYDAFGNLISQSGATLNVYLYAGEQIDGDTGVYYLQARYLHSSTARFFVADEDPGIQFEPASLHKYLYANNDPINRRDPSGQFTLTDALVTVQIIGTIWSIGEATYKAGQFLSKARRGEQITHADILRLAAATALALAPLAGAKGTLRLSAAVEELAIITGRSQRFFLVKEVLKDEALALYHFAQRMLSRGMRLMNRRKGG